MGGKDKMTLRKKALLVIGLTLLSLIIALYLASRIIIMDSFSKLEDSNAERNVERIVGAYLDDISSLNTMDIDYASWDDTYTFMRSKSDDYILSNFVDDTFTKSKLNLLLILNNSGQIVYKKGFDFAAGQS